MENHEAPPTFVPQDLFLWFSYFVPAPKREIFVPRKTLTDFATPEVAAILRTCPLRADYKKVKTLSWAERGRFGIDIV